MRRGVAKDRVLSVVDPEMRCGHKSQRQAWAGYKVHVAEQPESELITEVEVRQANEYDADAALAIMERQKESTGLMPKELLCDGAYGSADVRAKLGELGVRVVAKLRPLTDAKHLGKDKFEIYLRANDGAGSVTCPALCSFGASNKASFPPKSGATVALKDLGSSGPPFFRGEISLNLL